MKSPVDLLFNLIDDVERLEPGARGLDRDRISIRKRVKNEGIGFLTYALPRLCEAFDRGLADAKFACPAGFARIPRGTIPRLFSGMFCKVFDSVTGEILENPDVSMVTSIRQITRFFKKLALDTDQDEDLDRIAKAQFVQDEIHVTKGHSLCSRKLHILDFVARVCLAKLDTFDERVLPCKHGPGAVYEGLSPNQKWEALLTYSSELERCGFDTFYTSDGLEGSFPSAENPQYGTSDSTARLITVPKNSNSRRTITVEPVVRMFVQQGYNAVLRSAIHADPILSQCLALTSQEQNQKLALEGSRTGYWATLDLKAASDKLSLQIVKQVFHHKPLFLEGVLKCRSSHVEFDGCRIELAKYAGMGNATTFPIQSVVFAILAICALVQDSRLTRRNVLQAARLVRVFGDDIIIPSDRSHQVVDWITSAGLTVNEGKSFTVGNFRESCGVDAYAGVDVTPMYCRHRPDLISRKDPSAMAGLVSLCNQAWLRCYYKTATALQDLIEARLRKRLPLVSSTSGSLGLHTRKNYRESTRWNRDLHRPEVNAPAIITVKRRDELYGYAALLKFYFTSSDTQPGSILDGILEKDAKHLQESPIRFQLRIVSRWVPT